MSDPPPLLPRRSQRAFNQSQDGLLEPDVGGTSDFALDPWSARYRFLSEKDQPPLGGLLVPDVGGTPDTPLFLDSVPPVGSVHGGCNLQPAIHSGWPWLQPLQQGSLPAVALVPRDARQENLQGNQVAVAVCAVLLRGLPFWACQQDVLAFFVQHSVAEHIADGTNTIELRSKLNGRPSGHAVVRARTPEGVQAIVEVLHGQYLGTRYIEVFPHISG